MRERGALRVSGIDPDGEPGGRVEGDGRDKTECNGGQNAMGTAGSIDPLCGRRLFSWMAGSCLSRNTSHTQTYTQTHTHTGKHMLVR